MLSFIAPLLPCAASFGQGRCRPRSLREIGNCPHAMGTSSSYTSSSPSSWQPVVARRPDSPSTQSSFSDDHSLPRSLVSLDEQALLASQEVHSTSEMCAYIVQLRRSKLALLADDLLHRVRCEHPTASGQLLDRLSSLASALLTARTEHNDGALRTDLRECLWELRVELDPHDPSETVRSSLELVRSGLLDIPPLFNASPEIDPSPIQPVSSSILAPTSPSLDSGALDAASPSDAALLRSEMHHLMIDNLLLEELRSLRVFERQVSDAIAENYPDLCHEERRVLYYSAACELGFDEYRVRSKTRMAQAAEHLHNALLREISIRTSSSSPQLVDNVKEGLHVLTSALRNSLESDLQLRRPAGEAMLLRPRIVDIPNFAVVSPNLLRGGQPSICGVKWLQQCGVSLVIDLRGSDRGNQWASPDFDDILPRRGSRIHEETDGIPRGYVSLKKNASMSSQHSVRRMRYGRHPRLRVRNIAIEDFDVPSDGQVDEFVSLVDEITSQNGVIFVHCKAGIGRTGTLVACWRICKGEPVDEALSKERLYSAHGGGLRQESFVREFASRMAGHARARLGFARWNQVLIRILYIFQGGRSYFSSHLSNWNANAHTMPTSLFAIAN